MTLPQLLDFARARHPEKLSVVPVLANTRDEWMRRESPTHPATIEVRVPDELVKALRGPKAQRPLAVFLVIPREVADEASSPIIRPQGIVV